jgi:hypothetical protein
MSLSTDLGLKNRWIISSMISSSIKHGDPKHTRHKSKTKTMTGWWCNNHLEKYEFVNGKDYPIYCGK